MDEFKEDEMDDLKELIAEFADVFALNDQELGCTTLTKHRIDTGDQRPIRQQPYRTPVVRREKVAQMIDQMMKYFSSLDLLSGYWQVELDEEARQKSAFITYDGLFEFVRMPFGL